MPSRGRATAHRSAQILNLILKARLLIALLRLLERVVVLAAGFLELAHLAVGVAEMLGDSRIVVGNIDRALELLNRLLVVALLIVDPSKAVDIETIFRLDGERALDEAFRLVKILARFGIGISEIVERLRVLRIELDGFFHF